MVARRQRRRCRREAGENTGLDVVETPRIGRYGELPSETKVYGGTPTVFSDSCGSPNERMVCNGTSKILSSTAGHQKKIKRPTRRRL